MGNKIIRVLMIEPKQSPKISHIGSSLQDLRVAVSIGADEVGNVKSKKIGDGVYVLFNDDGFFAGLEANRRIDSEIISGVFYVIATDENYHPVSLTEDQILKYMTRFLTPEKIPFAEILDCHMNRLFESIDENEQC